MLWIKDNIRGICRHPSQEQPSCIGTQYIVYYLNVFEMFRKQAQDIKMGTILFEKCVNESAYFILQFYQCFWKYWKANWDFCVFKCYTLIIYIHFIHIIIKVLQGLVVATVLIYFFFLCFSFSCNFYTQIILIKIYIILFYSKYCLLMIWMQLIKCL